jgi:hypothetical protein
MIMILTMDAKSSFGRASLHFKKTLESASTIPA